MFLYILLLGFIFSKNFALNAEKIPNSNNIEERAILYPLPYFSPFQVLLKNGNDDGSYCAGTIISEEMILVLTECILGDNSNLEIFAGVRNLNDDWEPTRLSVPHEGIKREPERGRLSLIEVLPIRFNVIVSDIAPLNGFMQKNTRLNDFMPGVASWGATFTNNDNVMKMYPFQVIEWEYCDVLKNFKDYIVGNYTFCAICTYNISLCGIELGDAFVVTDQDYSEFFLYGFSYKIRVEHDKLYVAFVSIAKYEKWIAEEVTERVRSFYHIAETTEN